jgi:hypothetical protein
LELLVSFEFGREIRPTLPLGKPLFFGLSARAVAGHLTVTLPLAFFPAVFLRNRKQLSVAND